MYLKRYKISKAAFLENTSRQLSLYVIWFRISPKWKYYFKSDTYLKLSQTSKMKLLVKVVYASRDVFRTVFSIQSVFRTSKMDLSSKIMNGWKPLTFSAKSSILGLEMPLDSQCLTIFSKNCVFKRANMPLHVFSCADLEMNKWN